MSTETGPDRGGYGVLSQLCINLHKLGGALPVSRNEVASDPFSRASLHVRVEASRSERTTPKTSETFDGGEFRPPSLYG